VPADDHPALLRVAGDRRVVLGDEVALALGDGEEVLAVRAAERAAHRGEHLREQHAAGHVLRVPVRVRGLRAGLDVLGAEGLGVVRESELLGDGTADGVRPGAVLLPDGHDRWWGARVDGHGGLLALYALRL